MKIIPEKGQNLTTLVFSDDSNPYLSLYEATPQQNGTFEDPVALDIGSSTKSFVLSDLGRESQIFQYSFVGGEDRAFFDENRFKDGGKLYFSTLPDYEDPDDLGEFNRYDVMVKVEDGNGESTIQSVVVLVNDKNDAPYITSLDGNWTSSFNHLETNTTLDLFTVEASNTETDVGDNGKAENHASHQHSSHPNGVLHVAASAAHQISSPVVERTAALTTVDFLAASPFFFPFHNFSFIEFSA